jgi:hypothetical protein
MPTTDDINDPTERELLRELRGMFAREKGDRRLLVAYLIVETLRLGEMKAMMEAIENTAKENHVLLEEVCAWIERRSHVVKP